MDRVEGYRQLLQKIIADHALRTPSHDTDRIAADFRYEDG
jgi:hypothetical protein